MPELSKQAGQHIMVCTLKRPPLRQENDDLGETILRLIWSQKMAKNGGSHKMAAFSQQNDLYEIRNQEFFHLYLAYK